MYEKYLKEFANKTIVSYETWKDISKIIDDCDIYIDSFERKQYFDYLYAFYEEACEENRDIMDVVREYQKAMQNTLGYQCRKLHEEILKEFKPILDKLLNWIGGKK